MPILLATLLVAAQPQPALGTDPFRPGRTATIFATIGHSEWCPAGNVSLDLVTGDYVFTSTAPRRTCAQAGLERPARRGRLDRARLTTLRRAFAPALAEGFDRETCRNGGRPDEISLSNGGPPIMLANTGRMTMLASHERGCWNQAARTLYDALETAFPRGPAR